MISRLFVPGSELVGGGEGRVDTTVARVMALSDDDVDAALSELFARFAHRHEDLADVFERHASMVAPQLAATLSRERRQLLGATFTHEYSLEGASLTNPSIVAHPDQSGLATGALRVIVSYRSIGEGHHSSICFRTGEIGSNGELRMNDPLPYPVVGSVSATTPPRDELLASLREHGQDDVTLHAALGGLAPDYTWQELERSLADFVAARDDAAGAREVVDLVRQVTASWYEAVFDERVDVSRRTLWPTAPVERRGMEDARFVAFDDDGVTRYLASYTAFDGRSVRQQLLETSDFVTFHSSPLSGIGASNKGLAFFPRRVNGRFTALSRHDRETNAVAFSDSLTSWNEVAPAQIPQHPWEILQLGNCGSPIELAQGWLVITHGVGPMRTYGIGALLLDLDDPTRVVAQLRRPLLLPDPAERDGYVPNVVYSCGSLVHAGRLYLPYGVADQAVGFATVAITDLLAAFEPVDDALRTVA